LGALDRVRIDAELAGQLVGGGEADAPDVVGEAVGVGADDVERLVAVGLVDADGAGRAQAVRLKEDEDVAHRFLLLPALADLLDAAGPDAADVLQERRALIDDVERLGAEDADNLL